MKKKLCVMIAVVVSVLFVLFGCAAGSKTYNVDLEGNMTTGYSWQYTMSKDGIVKEKSNEYVQDEVEKQKEGEPPLVGMGGMFKFVFEGVSEGEVELDFKYSQEWDETTEPAGTAKIVLSVDKNGNVKEVSKVVKTATDGNTED
ncbi:MAG: protease inhibitor I42 family protein [Christensenella sp.]